MQAETKLIYTPTDYQEIFLRDYLQFIESDQDCRLYASATGSGKSIMELLALQADPGAFLITPRLEIVAGMLNKLGIKTDEWADTRLAAEALKYRITTPIRFRNMLAKGELPCRPERIIIDEAHHTEADTYKDLRAYLPLAKRVGLTASPFRGTPKSTDAFLKDWNERVNWILNIPQAAKRGVITIPDVELWPLVDDEMIDLSGGEFKLADSGNAAKSRLADVVERVQAGNMVDATGVWDRATVFAVPTTDNVHDLVERLNTAGCPAVGITQDTPRSARNEAFANCVLRRVAIVQINVVSEGVDLPIRRVIDLRPTMSPVWWVQMVGRSTRPLKPGELNSVYICCNRNLERHGYIFEGMIPAKYIAAAQQMFPAKSQRAGARAVGVEGIGRFAAAEVPFSGGLTGQMYNLTCMDGFQRTEYAIILHPTRSEPLCARKQSVKDPATGAVQWGKWTKCEQIPDVTGYRSAPAANISDKQRAFWNRASARAGLDPMSTPNKRNFAALPVILDTGGFK